MTAARPSKTLVFIFTDNLLKPPNTNCQSFHVKACVEKSTDFMKGLECLPVILKTKIKRTKETNWVTPHL